VPGSLSPGSLDPRARAILERAGRHGGAPLAEPEAFDLIEALGFATPRRLFAAETGAVAGLDLDRLPGERVVVKAVAPGLVHKTEAGAVAVVDKSRAAVDSAVAGMAARLADAEPGFLLCEHVAHETALGGEVLLSLRWSEAHGPLVTLAPGGVQTEMLAARLDRGRAAAVLSPALDLDAQLAVLAHKSLPRLLTRDFRGRPAMLGAGGRGDGHGPGNGLRGLLSNALRLAGALLPDRLSELEINPLALTASGPVALDVLARPAGRPRPVAPERPLDKLDRLLCPASIAVVGVSSGMNPGRIILRNVLASGFDPEKTTVVKPGRDTLDGVRCVPDVGELPGRVDLLVVALEAAGIPDLVDQVLASAAAETMILIPGGIGERSGSEPVADRLRDALAAARGTTWRGPLINGGNCLGVRSLPGRYDTTFIPDEKLPRPGDAEAPLAVISQSGAFAVSRASRLTGLDARYSISVGNQLDLTVGDYLSHLAADPELDVYACYVEGFQPLDGRKWLAAAAGIAAEGGSVVLYQAGRTRAGVDAAASHTASMAGDWQATRELAEAAGVLVAEELADFEDLTRLSCMLRGRRTGRLDALPRLGVLSNAGFECVAAADAAARFELAALSAPTRQGLDELFRDLRLDAVVGTRNPLDVTPIADDAAFARAAELVLTDPEVEVGVIGCVPLTGALATLPEPGGGLAGAGSVASRLGRLWAETDKAWVGVVDAGPLYDPFARRLEALGIPTLRSVDRALRLLDRYARHRRMARRLASAARESMAGSPS
jgi:acyl-CoA synthetase (NDP forming)